MTRRLRCWRSLRRSSGSVSIRSHRICDCEKISEWTQYQHLILYFLPNDNVALGFEKINWCACAQLPISRNLHETSSKLDSHLALRLAQRLARVNGMLLRRYFSWIGPTLAVSFYSPLTGQDDDPAKISATALSSEHQPRFVALWTADHLNLMAIAFSSATFLRTAQKLVFLVDDSIGGQSVANVLESSRIPVVAISGRGEAERLRTLRQLMEVRSPLILVVDGRGPYFKVGTGIVSLARAMNGAIQACSVHSSRSLLLPNWKVPLTVPRRYSRLLVRFGGPINCGPRGGEESLLSLAKRVERELNDLRAD